MLKYFNGMLWFVLLCWCSPGPGMISRGTPRSPTWFAPYIGSAVQNYSQTQLLLPPCHADWIYPMIVSNGWILFISLPLVNHNVLQKSKAKNISFCARPCRLEGSNEIL